MVVQEVYRNPKRLDHPFNFENDGQETLEWLRDKWRWEKDRQAKLVHDKLSRKIAAWKKKKAQDIKDERERLIALQILYKMHSEYYSAVR